VLVICCALFWTGFASALTPVGVKIANTAFCTYSDEQGFSFTAVSNTVHAQVAQVYGISITPDGTQAAPGQVYQFFAQQADIPYLLKNTGNGSDTYRLFPSNLSNDAGDLSLLTIYIDKNQNGVADPGEPAYDNTSPPSLPAGASIALVVSGAMESGIDSGGIDIDISGESVNDPAKTDTNNVSRINISSDGFIRTTKSVDKHEALPGERLNYRIDFSNQGAAAVSGALVGIDMDNDGLLDLVSGVLVSDPLPDHVSLVSGSIFLSDQNLNWTPVFAGFDGAWKTDAGLVSGNIRHVGLFIPASGGLPPLEAGKHGYITFSAKIDENAPAVLVENRARVLYADKEGEKTVPTNIAVTRVLPLAVVVADDTDDNGAHTGAGIYTDTDDLMQNDHAAAGAWISFSNEAWNLGNAYDIINIVYDPAASINMPAGTVVKFNGKNNARLVDTNADGLPDTGSVKPGAFSAFTTLVYFPPGTNAQDVFIAIRAESSNNPDSTDLTFDSVGKLEGVQVKVEIKVNVTAAGQAGTGVWSEKKPLANRKIRVFEYADNGDIIRQKLFFTDAAGFIVYDENGTSLPLYNWMEDSGKYRISLDDEYKGFPYYLTPVFYKSDFDKVAVPGDTFNRGEVSVSVEPDGTRLLSAPLDPAGYVFDAVTGARINGACVTFYHCDSPSCSLFSPVDSSVLDFYPDGHTFQENHQISGPYDKTGSDVKKSDGAFEFRFADYKQEFDGWYYIGADFTCADPASDPSLADKYTPVSLRPDSEWSPLSGAVYQGEKFFIDKDFPGAILLRVPLVPSDLKPLKVTKTVGTSSYAPGDLIPFTVTVENANAAYTVFDVTAKDLLPKDIRYQRQSTKIDGSRVSDPMITPSGTTLSWNLGDMAPGKKIEIKFYAIAAAFASEGRKTNTALASGWSDTAKSAGIDSNIATASFSINKGVFTDLAYIIGKVFVDDNDNRVQDKNEQGIAGIKIYMEDGRYVVTDSQGKYHMDNIRPGTHVLKVDKTTLPAGGVLGVINNRNVDDPDSSFADILPGDLYKVNFRIKPGKPDARISAKYLAIKGDILVSRLISSIVVDPTSGSVYLKHRLEIENKSKFPLYEITYRENSKYTPIKGTSYINDGAYDNPARDKDGFFWAYPFLDANKSLVLTFTSSLADGGGPASGEVTFHIDPAGKGMKLSAVVPISFSEISKGRYGLTVYFGFGKYELTAGAKKSLDTIISFLRKKEFNRLVVNLYGHTDNVRVFGLRKDFKNNFELSKKRIKSVKKYLAANLIDLHKLEFKAGIKGAATATEPKKNKPKKQVAPIFSTHPMGASSPAVKNLDSPVGTPENRRVKIDIIPLTTGSSKNMLSIGDALEKGIYKISAVVSGIYPLHKIYDTEIYVRLSGDFRYINGSASINNKSTAPVMRGEYLTFKVKAIKDDTPVKLEFNCLAAKDLNPVRLSLAVFAKTENGKIIHNTGPDVSGQAISAMEKVYLAGKTAITDINHAAVQALKKRIRFGIVTPAMDLAQTEKITDITIVTPAAKNWRLEADGHLIENKLIAEKASDPALGIITTKFIGIPLTKGKNTILLYVDGALFDEKTILVSGEISDITWSLFPSRPPADGRTPAYVILTQRDASGLRVIQNGYITAYVDKGDIFDNETNRFKRFASDGFKVRCVAGQGILKLSPSETSELRRVRIEYGNISRDIDVRFYPESRPWIVAGEVTGGMGLSKQKNSPPRQPDDAPFDHSTGRLNAEGRAALFAKGDIKGYTTTLRYDTKAPNEKNTLLKQNTPAGEDDRFYPVYGDESEQYFEAKSARQLYLKVEKNLNYFLFGDFNTDFGTGLEYNKYDRTFNGGLVNIESNKNYRVKGFVTQNNQAIVQESLAGRGISGPYFLKSPNLVINSEKVWIETRDRYNNNLIIDRRQVSRYTDYSIDYSEGWIIFSEPVRSYDKDLNPIFIYIVYETQKLNQNKYMYGMRAEKDFFDGKLTMGASGVVEEQPVDDKHLFGADITYDDNKHIRAVAEIAGTRSYNDADLDTTSGTAGRVEAEYRTGRDTKVNAYYKRVNSGFQNLSATNAQTRYETYGLTGETSLNNGKTRFSTDMLVERNTGLDRTQTSGRVEQELNDYLSGTLGVRWNSENGGQGSNDDLQGIAGLKVDPTKKLSMSIRREQSIGLQSESNYYPDKTAARINYDLTDDTDIYVTSEIQEQADKNVAVSTFGVDSRVDENTTAFSKYTIDDSVSGWRNQSHLGVTHQYLCTHDLTFDMGLENVKTFSGDDADDYVAPRAGFTYLQKDRYKMTGRTEFRVGKSKTDTLLSLGGTVKINPSCTLFARGRFFDSDYRQTDLLTGLAVRPVENDRMNLVTKFRWKKEERDDLHTTKYIGSLHLNYQPVKRLDLMCEYAAKYTYVREAGDTFTDLVRGRILYDITDRFDAGIQAGLMTQHDTNTYTLAWGPEVGARIIKNFWLGAGYNFTGFYDEDFDDANYWAKGFYIKFRIKFDEELLKKMGLIR